MMAMPVQKNKRDPEHADNMKTEFQTYYNGATNKGAFYVLDWIAVIKLTYVTVALSKSKLKSDHISGSSC